MSKSFALSTNVLLIFVMQQINGALFLKANYLSYALLFGSITLIVPLTTIYASLFALPTEVILSAILLPIKSSVASAVFLTTLLDAVFAASFLVFVAVSINFLPY